MISLDSWPVSSRPRISVRNRLIWVGGAFFAFMISCTFLYWIAKRRDSLGNFRFPLGGTVIAICHQHLRLSTLALASGCLCATVLIIQRHQQPFDSRGCVSAESDLFGNESTLINCQQAVVVQVFGRSYSLVNLCQYSDQGCTTVVGCHCVDDNCSS
jgi:hypothetical protein